MITLYDIVQQVYCMLQCSQYNSILNMALHRHSEQICFGEFAVIV